MGKQTSLLDLITNELEITEKPCCNGGMGYTIDNELKKIIFYCIKHDHIWKHDLGSNKKIPWPKEGYSNKYIKRQYFK